MDRAAELFRNILAYGGPALEIAILALLIYYILYYLRGTRSANILAGIIIAITLLTFVTENLKLSVLSWLLNGLWAVFPVALLIIFQPDLRRAFAQLGSRPFARRIRQEEAIHEVVTAAQNLSKSRTGALIVFQRQIGMRALFASGTVLDAGISHSLIETIFHPGTPLHDGGIIIGDNKIVAAHIIFPLSQDEAIAQSFGTRHRAALGISEETDAVAVVVSETNGQISVACRGELARNVSPEKLSALLQSILVDAKDFLESSTNGSGDEQRELDDQDKEIFRHG